MKTVSTCGITFCEFLTLIFVVLKLLGKITWSWIWVFSPLWISFSLVFIVLTLFILIVFIFPFLTT